MCSLLKNEVDTYGILEPGEVFFKSSRREFTNPDGSSTDIVVGEILLTRHPCKLPTDIQKVDFVSFTKQSCFDVHVDERCGQARTPSSYRCDCYVHERQQTSSGLPVWWWVNLGLLKHFLKRFFSLGDYDGDKGTFIYQPELVKPFANASLSYSEPPKDINAYFFRENLEVTTFQEQTASVEETEKIRRFQEYLLGSVRNMSVVGKYSTFHDIATYTLGYSHPDTIRLAYM